MIVYVDYESMNVTRLMSDVSLLRVLYASPASNPLRLHFALAATPYRACTALDAHAGHAIAHRSSA